jgi:hypothetical protein
LDCGRNS